jgi:hypothetical protein
MSIKWINHARKLYDKNKTSEIRQNEMPGRKLTLRIPPVVCCWIIGFMDMFLHAYDKFMGSRGSMSIEVYFLLLTWWFTNFCCNVKGLNKNSDQGKEVVK